MASSTLSTLSLHGKSRAAAPRYASALFALRLLLVLAAISTRSALADQWPLVLEYYMHYDVGVNVVLEIPPHDSNDTSRFGLLVAMDLPLTLTPDPDSTSLGAERCLAALLSLHYNPDYISNTHMCTVTYDDGVYHGVFSTMGEFNPQQPAAFEYGVTGGSIDFRGVQGYVVATLHSNVSSHIVYHFYAHLRLPDPPFMTHSSVTSQLKYNVNV